MGTYQQLTTEQILSLIVIEEASKCMEEDDCPFKSISEALYMYVDLEEDEIEICKTLKYYGYIEYKETEKYIDYVLTIDGKQYIRLFKEYLTTKAENVQFIHNSYSLINIDKLKLNLEACLGKVDISTGLSEIVDFMKGICKKKDN